MFPRTMSLFPSTPSGKDAVLHRHHLSVSLRAIVVSSLCTVFLSQTLYGQFPSFGPTASVGQAVATPWPVRPPARIYVLTFAMEPGLEQDLRNDAAGGIIPAGPVRQLLASRPRAVDLVTGYDRSLPIGVTAAKMLTDTLNRSGLPAVLWPGPGLPPPDGWRLSGQIVSLDPGSVVARNVIGFGAGNKTIGVDVMLSDPSTAGGTPFFVLDSSDKGRMMPSTLVMGAVTGFNPYVVAGRAVASQTGISDVTQQQRLADEIAGSLLAAFQAHGFGLAR